jgi:thiamine kinase
MSVAGSPPSQPDVAPPPTAGAAEREARDALRADTATATLAEASFERIPFGLSNVAWRVTPSSGASVFVRLAAPHTEQLGADHRNECRVLSLAADAGVAPPVVRCDPSARVLVTQWVDAAPPPTDVEQCVVVAALLARLHTLALPAGVREVDFGRHAKLLELALPPSRREPALEQVASGVFDRLHETRRALVFCHHDLHPLNLVWDRSGRPWLVDWEYAGRGDAAIDLASYASQHGLRADARARLLQHYLAAGGVPDARRLELATFVFDYVQWLWYVATLDTDRSPPERELVATRARRLHASLRARASAVLRCDNAGFEA